MKKLTLTLIVFTLTFFSVSSIKATQLSIGGQVPLIAEVLGMGFASLDLSVDGADVTVGQLIVSCNAPDFDVTFSASNWVAAADPDPAGARFVNISTPASVLFLTALTVSAEGSGTLGDGADGLTAATDINSTGEATWDIAEQTTATVDYVIDLNASWTADATLLAGFYREKVIVTIAPTL